MCKAIIAAGSLGDAAIAVRPPGDQIDERLSIPAKRSSSLRLILPIDRDSIMRRGAAEPVACHGVSNVGIGTRIDKTGSPSNQTNMLSASA